MFKSYPKPTKQKKTSKQEVWYNVMHNEIVPQFELWGITWCELNLDGCVKTSYLGFAHTKKRRNITTPEDLRRVVLACQSCHHIVEYQCVAKTGKTMTEYLDEVIERRRERLCKLGLMKNTDN